MLSLGCFEFSVGIRNFVKGLSQISSLFSRKTREPNLLTHKEVKGGGGQVRNSILFGPPVYYDMYPHFVIII